VTLGKFRSDSGQTVSTLELFLTDVLHPQWCCRREGTSFVFWFRDLLLLISVAWYRGAVRRFSTGQEVPWDDLNSGCDHYSDRNRVSQAKDRRVLGVRH